MRVLFLSVSTGGGHLKAAEALCEYIKKREKTVNTLIIDALKYVNPFLDKLIVKTYLNTLKATPQIYGKLYQMSESQVMIGENINDFNKLANNMLSFKIKKLLNDFNPDVVVCTHPFALQMVTSIKKRKKYNIPIVAVITDYAIHPFWIREDNDVDAYVIPHEFLKNEAVSRGIREEKIFPFGIPVNDKFLKNTPKDEVLEKFDLEDKLTFLIMGGSLGFGEIEEIFIELLKSTRNVQIVVVTGTNLKLKYQLEKYSHEIYSDKNIVILGYVAEINELMDIADFIITKPGGLTVSEALIKKLPILIMSPIPGQEEKNSYFLINCGAAARIVCNENIDNLLSQVVDNPVRVKNMKEISEILAKPNSCEDIYVLLKELIKPI